MSKSTYLNLSWIALWLAFSIAQSSGQNFWERTNGPYLGTIDALFVEPTGVVFAGSYR